MSSWKYNTFSWSYLKTAFEKVEKNVSQKFAIYIIASVLEEANKSSLTLSVFHVTNMVKVLPTSSQFPHWLYETGLLSPLCRWEDWGPTGQGNLLKVMQQEMAELGFQTSSDWLQPPALILMLPCLSLAHSRKLLSEEVPNLFFLTAKLSVPAPVLTAVFMGRRGSESLRTVFD